MQMLGSFRSVETGFKTDCFPGNIKRNLEVWESVVNEI